MSYIEKNLMKEEKLIYSTKMHWIIFFGPTLVFVFSLFFYSVDPIIATLFLLITMIMYLGAFIIYKTSEFGVTNKRVIIKTGFIKRTSLETLLTKIEGILVDQSIPGRILNFGTIVIKGTGGTGNPFKSINDPLEFRKQIQELISQEK